MKNWGSILEPACLYADQGVADIEMLVETVKHYGCRSAVVHFVDLEFLFDLEADKKAVVIDFPNGKGNTFQVRANAGAVFINGIRKIDVCLNLANVLSGAFGLIAHNFSKLRLSTNDILVPEIKAIIQLPYLWQYMPRQIEPLVTALADAGVSVVKDWTTVHNFSKPIDVSDETRVKYTSHLKNLIERHNFPLQIKVAGGVRANNARAFVNAGADILGVGVQFVPDVIKALESSE